MLAMRLDQPGRLRPVDLSIPQPEGNQVLVKVEACGVCRTDLHVVDHELPDVPAGIVPGHEIVGRIVDLGRQVRGLSVGQRVGVPWLGWTCGECRYCRAGQENLCESARFTGYQIDGGYAEYALADARYCFGLPDHPGALELAPLMCAGLIGHRAWTMAGEAEHVGLYGFGAAAHILTQVLVQQGRKVYAFTREQDLDSQRFAVQLGASWAGDSGTLPPVALDAALLFAPSGELVPRALTAVRPGGTVVCAGIHMSDIPSFPYRLLWGERSIRSVANLTRQDGEVFLKLAPRVPVHCEVTRYPLIEANQALADLREGRLQGAAVLVPEH